MQLLQGKKSHKANKRVIGWHAVNNDKVKKDKNTPNIELFSVCKHGAPKGKDHTIKDHAVRQVHKRRPEAGCLLLTCQVVNRKDPSL